MKIIFMNKISVIDNQDDHNHKKILIKKILKENYLIQKMIKMKIIK